MLTRKDFETLAQVIKANKPQVDDYSVLHSQWRQMQSSLAAWATLQNPNFDRDRFNQACGL